MNILEMLKKDHMKVNKMLEELEKQPTKRKGINTEGFLAKFRAWLERNF